ncbi:MAG: sugar phosphate isomerase/epimerase [Planctomycetaceae bacterium]|nr:sugar phosphate isomerase/epimerase [Planctomycetaceae bacterium]
MKVCVSSVCWWGDDRVSLMKKAAAAGFKAIEILTFPEKEICKLHGDLRQLKSSQLRQELADHGLTLAGLHLGAIMTPTEEKRRAQTDYCKRGLEVAVDLGAAVIVEGGPDRATEPIEPYMKSLEELVPLFEQTPVKLALENHYRNWLQYIPDYDWVFSRITSPSVGMTLDTGHFTSAKVDPIEVARVFGKKVVHVHIKDHIDTQSVALGEGKTDNFGTVRALREAGYDGYLSQEAEVADHSRADQVAHDGFKYMQRLVQA